MDFILQFLQNNSQWLFGGGGLAAIVIALFKFFGQAKAPAKPNVAISGGNVGGSVNTGDKITSHTTKNGFGGLEFALSVALIVAVIGAVFVFLPTGTTVTATGGSAATVGDGNTTTVTTGN